MDVEQQCLTLGHERSTNQPEESFRGPPLAGSLDVKDKKYFEILTGRNAYHARTAWEGATMTPCLCANTFFFLVSGSSDEAYPPEKLYRIWYMGARRINCFLFGISSGFHATVVGRVGVNVDNIFSDLHSGTLCDRKYAMPMLV